MADLLPVVQADRDLRKAVLKAIVDQLDRPCSDGDMIDDRTDQLDQIIAAHRIAHTTASDGLREALNAIECGLERSLASLNEPMSPMTSTELGGRFANDICEVIRHALARAALRTSPASGGAPA